MHLPCVTLFALASFAPVQACGTFAASATGAGRMPLQIDLSDDAANGLAIAASTTLDSTSVPFPWAASWSDSRTRSSRLVWPIRPATRAW